MKFACFYNCKYLNKIDVKCEIHKDLVDRWIKKDIWKSQFSKTEKFIAVRFIFTSVKSQSGDGVRRVFVSLTDGEELGSSGITAKRPRCTHGDVGPYVP